MSDRSDKSGLEHVERRHEALIHDKYDDGDRALSVIGDERVLVTEEDVSLFLVENQRSGAQLIALLV